MKSLVVYPSNNHQISLLTALLEEMKIRFSVTEQKKVDDSLMSKEEYYTMINASVKQLEDGKYKRVKNKEELHQFLAKL